MQKRGLAPAKKQDGFCGFPLIFAAKFNWGGRSLFAPGGALLAVHQEQVAAVRVSGLEGPLRLSLLVLSVFFSLQTREKK